MGTLDSFSSPVITVTLLWGTEKGGGSLLPPSSRGTPTEQRAIVREDGREKGNHNEIRKWPLAEEGDNKTELFTGKCDENSYIPPPSSSASQNTKEGLRTLDLEKEIQPPPLLFLWVFSQLCGRERGGGVERDISVHPPFLFFFCLL